MLGVSSIACKNNSTDNTPPIDELVQASGNVLAAIVKQDGTTFNSEITIKFNKTATLESALEGETALTIGDDITYANEKITFKADTLTSLQSGEANKKTYSLTFKDSDGKTATVEVTLQKTTLVDDTMINSAVLGGSISISDATTNPKYTFTLTGTASANSVEITSTGGAGSSDTWAVQTFTNELHQLIVADTTFQQYFSDISFADNPKLEKNAESQDNANTTGKMTLETTFIKDNTIEQSEAFKMILKLDKGNWK